jgi:hypothetical protein
MTRLYLFAEGQTEQTFATLLLKPQLAQRNIFMMNPVLIAHAKKSGKVHRGGGRQYTPMKNDILRFLKQEQASDVFFTTMIDLYALHSDFPGIAEAERMRHDPLQRVTFLEQCFADAIGDQRFIPYIQLHEYEAYLFSDPTCFAYLPSGNEQTIKTLQQVARQFATPELINDGQHTAPSKRIAKAIPDYTRAKSTFGPQLAELIGLSAIRSACPHFATWLARLESLAE